MQFLMFGYSCNRLPNLPLIFMRLIFYILLVFFCLLISCNSGYHETEVSLDSYVVEDGFNLKVLAAEPLLKAPVAIDFDAKGRIWVAQMPGYMHDLQGSG